jgi:cytochrome P450
MPYVLGEAFQPLVEDPYPLYTKLRQEEPITYSPELNAWLVTRYKDIQTILNQHEKFSSRNTLDSAIMMFHPQALKEIAKGHIPSPTILNTDSLDHTRLRKPLMKAFTPAHIKTLEPFVREVVNSLIDAFSDQGRAEFVSQFAYRLPFEVILHLIGIPKQDMERAETWVHDWLAMSTRPLEAELQVVYAQSTRNFQEYLVDLFEERRKTPQDDLISTMLQFQTADWEPFDEKELVTMVQGLIFAGMETTTDMLGNGILLLLLRPERWHTLHEHPEYIPQVIEEIMRFDGPIRLVARVTTAEVEIGGVTLPEGTSLLLVFGSGNRDEEIFTDPDEFQLQRVPNRHIGFGHGVHFCVGAALGRMEGQIAFEVLSQRLPQMRLVPEQELSHVPTLMFRSYERIEVEWS